MTTVAHRLFFLLVVVAMSVLFACNTSPRAEQPAPPDSTPAVRDTIGHEPEHDNDKHHEKGKDKKHGHDEHDDHDQGHHT